MADSRRLQILKQLEALPKTIIRLNGYNHDVRRVTRKFRNYSEVNEFIHVNLIAGQEQIRALTQRHEGMYNEAAPFNFTYENYVKAGEDPSSEGLLSNMVEEHIQDMKKLIYNNPTLGLEWVTEVGLDFVGQVFAWDQHWATVVIGGHVSFPWVGTDP